MTHVETRYLWVQERERGGHVTILPCQFEEGQPSGHVHEGGESTLRENVLATAGTPASTSICKAERCVGTLRRSQEVHRGSRSSTKPLLRTRWHWKNVVHQYALSHGGQRVLRVALRVQMWSTYLGVLSDSSVMTTGHKGSLFLNVSPHGSSCRHTRRSA